MNDHGIDRIKEFMEGFIEKAIFTVDGTEKDVPIKEIEQTNDGVKVSFYLTASDNDETITSVKLIDDQGLVIDEQTDIKEKAARQGLLVIFKYSISEVV